MCYEEQSCDTCDNALTEGDGEETFVCGCTYGHKPWTVNCGCYYRLGGYSDPSYICIYDNFDDIPW